MPRFDPLAWIARLPLASLKRSRIPSDLGEVTSLAPETPPEDVGLERATIERIWQAALALYRTGVHPALQLCIRRHGEIVLHRAIGHAAGNAPQDAPDSPRVACTTETPFNIFSASKAVTAMVIHKLDEQRLLHLEDPVCEFIPEFGRHGKHRITIRHILSHRAGIPNLPPEAIDLDLLVHPERVVEILADAKPRTRPGRLLAYHAVSGGFVLAEIVRRITGSDIRSVLEERISRPLGLRWMSYGVPPLDVPRVAVNAFTGPPVPPPMSRILKNALGTTLEHAIELSNDPRYLTGIVPSANVVTTAEELSAFYQCLLDGGALGGVRVFDPRTVRHASAEQNHWELDFTLGLPIRYGLGFMLGGSPASLYGLDNPQAFGHLGLSNVIAWADPERDLAAALLNSGKPILSTHVVRLVELMVAISRGMPKVQPRRRWKPASAAASLR
ncbi:MAG TPA: serine hydrolase domain-containing protein [Myxococcota bacterium]|jgi:CubicO group peptidase (beta-lactamase class C family)